MDGCIGHITTKDKTEALAIGRALVEKKLIACANVSGPIHSIFRWEEKIETAEEYLLLVKCTKKQKDKIISVVKALHSYSCPCIVFYDMHGGNPDYMKWIADSV